MSEAYHDEQELTPKARARAAKTAVMELPRYPDLHVRLTRAIGPNAARDMMEAFIYWFGRPGMQHRSNLYKTFDEWDEQHGLSRRQVNRGRDQLKALGLVTEEKGPYKRVQYQVDWEALASTLNLNPTARPKSSDNGIGKAQTPQTGRAVDDCTPQTGHEPHSHAGKPPKQAVQSRLHAPEGTFSHPHAGPTPHTYRENGSEGAAKTTKNTVQTNAKNYAVDYEQNIQLAVGAEPAFAEPAPHLNKEKGKESQVPSAGEGATSRTPRNPNTSGTKAQQGASEGQGGAFGAYVAQTVKPAPAPPRISKAEQDHVWRMILDEQGSSVPRRFALAHVRDKAIREVPITLELVAEKVAEACGHQHPAGAYLEAVRRGVDELRTEMPTEAREEVAAV